nr:unnamed protein product [Callosobruchus analis]
MVAMLTMLMPNVRGPKASKRSVLSSVASSIALYGAPIWGSALDKASNKKHLGGLSY